MKITVFLPDGKIHVEGEKTRRQLLNKAKGLLQSKYNVFHLKDLTYIAVKKDLLTK